MANPAGKWLAIEEYVDLSGRDGQEVYSEVRQGDLISKEIRGEKFIWSEGLFSDAGVEPSREPGGADLAHQTNRALNLVERSLENFIIMHEQILMEKDELLETMNRSLSDKSDIIREHLRTIDNLNNQLHQNEQELADLRMLASLLEDQLGSARQKIESVQEPQLSEGRDLGDMMEDQLKYIMENQMINDLIKE